MIISNDEALKRLSSPLNLLNKMRVSSRSKAMDLFVPSASPGRTNTNQSESAVPPFHNPFEKARQELSSDSAIIPEVLPESESTSATKTAEPTLDTLIASSDNDIKLALAHDTALDVINSAMKKISNDMDNIKSEKLPSVITAASKIVEGIRKERNENSKTKIGRDVHLHFYTPIQKKMEEYEVVEVG